MAIAFGTIYLLLALMEALFPDAFGGRMRYVPIPNAIHWVAALLFFLAGMKEHTRRRAFLFALLGAFFFALFLLDLLQPALLSDLFGYPVLGFYQALYGVTGIAALMVGIRYSRKNG